jgi:hypothetical protein
LDEAVGDVVAFDVALATPTLFGAPSMNILFPVQISSAPQLADDHLAPDRITDREEKTGAQEEMGGSDAKYPAAAGLADFPK